MNQWPLSYLDQCLASIRAGVSLGGADRTPSEGEVGILTLSAVSGNHFRRDECKAIAASRVSDLGDHIRAGSLLMSRSNTIDLVGSTVLVEDDHPDRFLPDLIWELRLREDAPVLASFLVDFFATPEGRRLLQSAAMGTSGSMKKLSMQRLRRLQIPIPPLPLQQAWEKFSKNFERHLSKQRELLLVKQEREARLMKELLTGRRRFSAFEERRVCVTSLGDVCDIQIGGTPRRDNATFWARDDRDGLPWAAISDLKSRWVRTTAERITPFGVENSTVKLVRAGTVLMSFKLTIGRVARAACDMFTNEAIAAIVPKDERVVPEYLSQVLPLAVLSASPDNAVKGATLNKSKLADILLRLPQPDEQRHIARIGDLLARELELHGRVIAKYEREKRALMHRLLSGDIPALDPAA